jgi:hypothetical protein
MPFTVINMKARRLHFSYSFFGDAVCGQPFFPVGSKIYATTLISLISALNSI